MQSLYLRVLHESQQQGSLHLGQLGDEVGQERAQQAQLLLNPPHILLMHVYEKIAAKQVTRVSANNNSASGAVKDIAGGDEAKPSAAYHSSAHGNGVTQT